MGRKREKGQEKADGVSILDLAKGFSDECCKAATEAKKPVFGTGNFRKKVVSEALAVHPEQIPEATELAKKLGVPVEFKPDGRPVFDNSAHFRRYAKRHGYRHRGYT